MVSEEELIKNRNATCISACILYDFSIINSSEYLKQTGTQILDGQILNATKIFNGWLLENKNYIINLDLMNLFSLNKVDYNNFNKELLLTIIKTSLNYEEIEIHKNGWLELKLPQVSY